MNKIIETSSEGKIGTSSKAISLSEAIMCRLLNKNQKQIERQPLEPFSPVKQLKHEQKDRLFHKFAVSQQLILRMQSSLHPGYFQFSNWSKLNNHLYPHISLQTGTQFWKILRTINYGQVIIPTGLIFDIFSIIQAGKYSQNHQTHHRVQRLILQFIKLNTLSKESATFNSFRSIKKRKSLKDICDQYVGKKAPQQKQQKNSLTSKQLKTVFKRMQQDIHNRNVSYQSHLAFKKLSILGIENFQSGIVSKKQKNSGQKVRQLQIARKPLINRECCRKNSLVPNSNKQQQKTVRFSVGQINPEIFDSRILINIPGIQKHVLKMRKKQAEKRRLQRVKEQPSLRNLSQLHKSILNLSKNSF